MLSKVKRGDAITAEHWNALVDEINARRISSDGTIRINRSPAGMVLGVSSNERGIPFKNNFAGDIAPYQVFSGTGIYTDWGGTAAILADRPSTTFRRTYYVNDEN